MQKVYLFALFVGAFAGSLSLTSKANAQEYPPGPPYGESRAAAPERTFNEAMGDRKIEQVADEASRFADPKAHR